MRHQCAIRRERRADARVAHVPQQAKSIEPSELSIPSRRTSTRVAQARWTRPPWPRLTLAALVSIGVYWLAQGGASGRLIEIDRASRQTAQLSDRRQPGRLARVLGVARASARRWPGESSNRARPRAVCRSRRLAPRARHRPQDAGAHQALSAPLAGRRATWPASSQSLPVAVSFLRKPAPQNSLSERDSSARGRVRIPASGTGTVVPFQLVSPFEPAGDQPQAIAALVDGLRERAQAPGADGRDRLGQDVHDGQRDPGHAAAHAGAVAQQDAGRPALRASSRSSFRTTRCTISSATTTTTSPKRTFRSATSTSRKTPRSTRRSTGCGWPRPAPWSAAAT